MKYSLMLAILLALLTNAQSIAANTDDDYMEGHPSYNDNYYNPSYNNSPSSPNYDSNYYDRTYNYNGNYQNGDDSTPHGNDIRDYNPAYDRYGNLK